MTNKTDPYTPVDCGMHSEFELAIMQRKVLPLTWRDENHKTHSKALLPVDLRTREQQEFLVAQDTNHVIYEIRLDKIIQTDSDRENNS